MSRNLGILVGLALLAALFSLAAACDGDDGDETTPTPAATITATVAPDLSAEEARLREMVLEQGDLPEGFGSGDVEFVTNEEASGGDPDPASRLVQLNEWGRILGIDVIFEPETDAARNSGIFLVNSTASIYQSEEGATASLADAVEVARATDWAALFGGVFDVQVEEMPGLGLADEVFWLRVTGKATLEEGAEQTLANDFVLLRQGSARGTLIVGSVVSPASSQVIDEMARVQAQRLIEAAE